MEQLLPLLYLFLFLFAGILTGKTRLIPRGRFMQIMMSICLYALLFFMGFRIGRNEEVGKNLASIGLLSLSYAVATVTGTILFLIVLFALTGNGRADKGTAPDAASSAGETGKTNVLVPWHHFREPLRLFAIVVTGFLIGLIRKFIPGFTGETLSTRLLYILIFFIGVELIRSGINIREVLAHPDTLLIPAGTVAGSLAGGFLLAWLLGVPLGKSLSLSSGFGWYSLSGVIISDLGDPVLGSAGFMANILRETIALLTIPIIARTRYPRIGIGVAGATSMDVTLPLIERTNGPKAVPVSIASGVILSLLVPVLVPLFYQLG